MRIQVTGDCPTAKALRGYLRRHDFHLTGHAPDWIVHIEEPEGTAMPVLDSAGGELEQAILRHLRKQATHSIEIHTGRTVSSEREIRILVPPAEEDRKAVEIGVFRGLLEIAKQRESSMLSPSRWWKTFIQRKTQ
jgi:hypothetical protein